jgi:pyroglutamyl-peptidase
MIGILATGFGAFPGVADNPSAALMVALQRRAPHFARLGIEIHTHVLPVLYEGLSTRLATLAKDVKPDAILHFGVAARRDVISVETCAHNRVSLGTADANAVRPTSHLLDERGPKTIHVRVPTTQIAAKIRAAGIEAKISRDAGTYLCNATLYDTLTSQRHLPVGFIHIPMPSRSALRSSRPRFEDIVTAADIAIVAVAAHVRHTRTLSAASAIS